MVHKWKNSIIIQVVIINIIILGIFLVVLSVVDILLFPSIFWGWLIASINLLWLLRTVKKGLGVKVEKILNYVIVRYYIRLITTIALIYFLISMHLVNLMGLLIGFSVTVLFEVITLVIVVKKGVTDGTYHIANLRS